MKPCGNLLGDIGGTNARFAVLNDRGEIRHIKIYQVRENPTFLDALRLYRNEFCQELNIKAVVMAVAGPVLNDLVSLTNSDWVCDKNELIREFGTESVFILNDFEAIAYAINQIHSDEITVIQTGKPSDRHPKIVMGPGTGLGVAALKPTGCGVEAITTEAGHVRYAPANERERKLVGFLSRSLNFVTAEHLVSGPGLVNIYQANCQMVGEEQKSYSPADIVDHARTGDPLCRQVLDDFAAIFGGFASHLALSYNALGGVYLTGGVLQKIGGFFNQNRFLERFTTNPRMSDLLNRMPIMWVKSEIPAFSGLKMFLKERNL